MGLILTRKLFSREQVAVNVIKLKTDADFGLSIPTQEELRIAQAKAIRSFNSQIETPKPCN